MTNTLSPFSTLADFTDSSTPNPLQHFLKKLADPCSDGDTEDDCGELTSPCCQAQLSTIFGSLPLEVKCGSCNKVFLLRDLVPLGQKELTTV